MIGPRRLPLRTVHKEMVMTGASLGLRLGCAIVFTSMSASASAALTFVSNSTIVVPSNVLSIRISMWGGGGGASLSSVGSAGAYVTGVLPVTPGQVISVVVGGGGGRSFIDSRGLGGANGGGHGGLAGTGGIGPSGPQSNGQPGQYGAGGGGFSGLFNGATITAANALAIAAGGGGAGGWTDSGGLTPSPKGAIPSLLAVPGSTLIGGSGGNGGNGGSLLSTNSGTGRGGNGGTGGGGAGGGFYGGPAGANGANGADGGLFATLGGLGGRGQNGGIAGCSMALLAETAGSMSPLEAARHQPVGTADPFFSADHSGFGGSELRSGGAGQVVIDYIEVPAPGTVIVVGGACMLSMRRRRQLS